ncbi:hypothetical protein M405DRAFT_50136 [Rhizopogon salebrosus TDB-379]|nr:hypothetical protein M405DRAFT_50136 [Rhizopogon salebrosus TDB-379]
MRRNNILIGLINAITITTNNALCWTIILPQELLNITTTSCQRVTAYLNSQLSSRRTYQCSCTLTLIHSTSQGHSSQDIDETMEFLRKGDAILGLSSLVKRTRPFLLERSLHHYTSVA